MIRALLGFLLVVGLVGDTPVWSTCTTDRECEMLGL